jgi:ATP-binding cassette subfamily C (CFTR/MRP) protein 1
MVLSNSARKESTVGQMTNLIAINAQSFTEVLVHFHLLWVSIVSIIVTMFMLYRQVGMASFAGVLFMVFLIPFTSFISQKSKSLQSRQYEYQDARIKAVNELLNGIKVIKLYAWELPLKAVIVKIRQSELRVFKIISFMNGFVGLVMNTSSFVVLINRYFSFT